MLDVEFSLFNRNLTIYSNHPIVSVAVHILVTSNLYYEVNLIMS